MKRIRGFVITAEALAVSLLILLVVSFAFMYASSFFSSRTKLTQTVVDGQFCGTVVILKNLGKSPAVVYKVVGKRADGTLVSISSNLLPLRINPGSEAQIIFSSQYANPSNPIQSVTVVGENFPVLMLKNQCTS